MNNILRKLSSLKSFYLFATLIIGVFALACIFVVNYILQSERNRISEEILFQTYSASKSVSDYLDETTHLTEFLARKIASDPTNLEFINFLFKRKFVINIDLNEDTLDSNDEGIFYWPFFKWVDSSNHVVVSALEGVMSKPFEKHKIPAKYVDEKKYWQPIFSDSIVNSKLGINMMVNDDYNNYLGSIVTDFDLNTAKQKILSSLKNKEIKFHVLDTNNKIIISSGNNSDLERDTFVYKIPNINYNKTPQGVFKNVIRSNDDMYLSYSVLKGTSFKVIVGGNEEIIYSSYYSLKRQIYYGLIGLAVFLILALYGMFLVTVIPMRRINKDLSQTKERLEQSLILSDECEENRKTHSNLLDFRAQNNLKDVAICISYLKSTMQAKPEMEEGTLIDTLDNINNKINNIRSGITGVEEVQSFNLSDSLLQCKKILFNELRKASIDIKILSDENITVTGDAACFNQLLMGLIGYNIGFVPKESNIIIKYNVFQGGEKQYIHLSMMDEGILEVQRRKELFSRYIFSNEPSYSSLDLQHIEYIADKMNITLNFENLGGKKSISLTIPLFVKEKTIQNISAHTNVIPLHKK